MSVSQAFEILPVVVVLPLKWQLQKFYEPEFLVTACITWLLVSTLADSLKEAWYVLAQK